MTGQGWTRRFRSMAMLPLLATAACGAASAPATPPGPPAAFVGTKGVSVHTWFTWPRQAAPDRYVFPAYQSQPGELTPAEARRVRALGFDFVRLTVEPGVFMSAAGADLDQATAALLAGIDRLRAAGLSVIVDLHPNDTYQPDTSSPAKGIDAIQRGPSDPVARRFASAAASLAGLLDRRYGASRRVAFEILNEPTLRCGAPVWRSQQAALHRLVRAAAPRLTLVLTGACYDGIDGLTALIPTDYADRNLLYTFHFYEDHRFTHQGTGQAGTVKGTSGLPYPWNARDRASVDTEVDARLAMLPDGGASVREAAKQSVAFYMNAQWDRAAIDRRFDQVAVWAKTNGIPPGNILLGEFGVNADNASAMGARDDDRLRWLTDVRQSAETHGFRWSFWSYRAQDQGMRLETDRASGAVDQAELRALGLPVAR